MPAADDNGMKWIKESWRGLAGVALIAALTLAALAFFDRGDGLTRADCLGATGERYEACEALGYK